LRAVRNGVHLQLVRPLLVLGRDSETAAARRGRGLFVSGVFAGGGGAARSDLIHVIASEAKQSIQILDTKDGLLRRQRSSQ